MTVVITPLDAAASVFSDFDAWNVARCLISHGLQQLDITDLVHEPTEETPFADIQWDRAITNAATRSTVHWRVEITSLIEFQTNDMLHSPDGWKERSKARLKKSMLAAHNQPIGTLSGPGKEDLWNRAIYATAETLRMRAFAAMEREFRQAVGSRQAVFNPFVDIRL